jgi:uncharacterized delta-60 repeat protein
MTRIIFSILSIVLILLSTFSAFSQPGTVDLSFNSSDYGFGATAVGANATVNKSVLQSDGKVIFVGDFTSYNATIRNRIARLKTNGTIDSTFNPGTGANNVISTVIIQSDGKIIIGGNFTSFNGTNRNRIARLNSDGSIDLTFNPGTGADFSVNALSLQSDGKILIGGVFTTYNGASRNNIARLNTDGSLDFSFNPGTGSDNVINSIALQSNGKIIIAGNFSVYNGTARNNIARINSDGTLDPTLNIGTGTNNTIFSTGIQSDGKVILVGDFTSYNSTTRNRIVRINTDGTIDLTFNVGTGADNAIFTSVIQSDGKILIGGNFTTYNGTSKLRITRLNSDGTLDGLFNAGAGWSVRTTFIQSDGKIIIGGDFTSFGGTSRNRLVRLNTNGSLDLLFNLETGANSQVRATTMQGDGKIIIGGSFTVVNNTIMNGIARLNTDGTLDLSFVSGTGIDLTNGNSGVNTISIQSDGKILIGGVFTTYNGTVCNGIARLNTDGSIDPTFNVGAGPNYIWINSLAIQTDGKILVGGTFTAFNGVTTNNLARLNTNGSVDISFNTGTGATATGGINWTLTYIKCISIQSNNKIIIGGNFTSYNGISRNGIARINSNGSLDLTFDPGTGVTRYGNPPQYNSSSYVLSTLILSDGKILIVGRFTDYNGVNRDAIAKLNTDGSLDNSFVPATGIVYGGGYGEALNTVVVQSDGKIIAASNRWYRFNENGLLDSTCHLNFLNGITNFGVSVILLQNDEKIIVGGGFTDFNGIGRNRIARIHNNIINTTAFGPSSFCPGESLSVSYTVKGIFPTGNVFTAQLSDNFGDFNSPTTIGSITSTTNGSINVSIPSGQLAGTGYRIRVVSSSPLTDGSNNGSDITIKPLPIVNANTTFTSICQGSSITLTASGTANTYSWSNGVNDGVSFIPTNSINNYIVSGTNTTTGCSNSDSITITVNSLPLVVANSTQTSICDGSSITLTASGADTYLWSNGVSNGVSIIPSLGSHVYTVTGTNAQTNCSNTATVSIVVNPLPAVTANTTQNNICAGTSIILTGGGANTYTWTNGVSNGISFVPNVGSTNYIVTGTNNLTGCSNTANITITVNPNPFVTATDNGDGTILASNGNYYSWLNCQTGTIIPGATAQTFTPLVNGSYAAIVNINGCSDTSSCVNITNVGIEDITKLAVIKIYPNPSNDNVVVDMNIPNASLIITDTQGKTLRNQFVENKEKINLSSFESGIYFFHFETDKTTSIIRVIKN